MYLESNFAKHYELEMSIRGTRQNDKSIQEFYNEMTSYWDQLALMEPVVLQTIDEYVQYREKQRLVQFLMALRDQFERLFVGLSCIALLYPQWMGLFMNLLPKRQDLKFIIFPLQLSQYLLLRLFHVVRFLCLLHLSYLLPHLILFRLQAT